VIVRAEFDSKTELENADEDDVILFNPMTNIPVFSRPSIGQTGDADFDHALMQDMDSVFSGEESTVIAAFQVRRGMGSESQCMHA